MITIPASAVNALPPGEWYISALPIGGDGVRGLVVTAQQGGRHLLFGGSNFGGSTAFIYSEQGEA